MLIDQDTTFIVQGITGREAVNLTRECLDYGSKVVGGVTPGRKGREVHGVPVYDSVKQLCEELGYDPAEKISIFRIPGAWEEEGFKILERYGVRYADRSTSLHDAARLAVAFERPEAARPSENAGPDAPRR